MAVAKAQKKVKPKAEKVHTKVLAQSKSVARKKLKLSNSDDTPCNMCTKRYNEPPFEPWQQCPTCKKWYHESCGPEDTAVCYYCQ